MVDLDATLIGAHSEKEGATPNFKRGFGFHPILAFVDHGAGGTGEPLAAMLRPGRANANDAADQIAVLDAALAQLPDSCGRGCWCAATPARGCSRCCGTSPPGVGVLGGHLGRHPVQDALEALPTQAWRAAFDPTAGPGGRPSRRADPVDAGHLHRLAAGMRIIARRERPHPGAQLRITDHDGSRITLFATNTIGGTTGRPGAAPPAAGPRRRPHPWAQGHRHDHLPLQAFTKNQSGSN